MKNFLIKCFMAFNTFLIRISGGRLGTQLSAGRRVLILHTVGRKSGQPRAIPILYFRDGENFFIVGSNWGREKHADWYFNLKNDPRAQLELAGKKIAVLARDATGDEFARLWKYATEQYPRYHDYQKNTTRSIPIVVFEPVHSSK